MIPGDFAWMSHMLRGDFEAAWRLSDRGSRERSAAGVTGADWPRHLRPVWQGVSLGGRDVLVRCHHGLGDTIQFMRYLPHLGDIARSVTLEVQPELAGLASSLSGIDRLATLGDVSADVPLAAYGGDVEVDITELPWAFRTQLATIPADIPYLRADPARIAGAAERAPSRNGVLRAGLVWAAGEWKPDRSVPLALLDRLDAVPGLALYCLQRGPEHARWQACPAGPAMAGDLSSTDIADTAAAISRLDLVITVDTMVAHLSGALGRPVWLLLHYAADWRWLLERDDSPWYPTMRVFRQRRPGDWAGVADRLAEALRSGAAMLSPASTPR